MRNRGPGNMSSVSIDYIINNSEAFGNNKPRLLLHSCCAPCSSYCLVYLREYFDITCLYYNPNITEREEYEKRCGELERLAQQLNNDAVFVRGGELTFAGDKGVSEDFPKLGEDINPIKVITRDFDPDSFIEAATAANLTGCPERGERCTMCFMMRLSGTYEVAQAEGFDYFTTSLTISPLKNASLINSIGDGIARDGIKDGPVWLESDFKKKNGYKISTQLSGRYGLYRQNYCGCIYSKR